MDWQETLTIQDIAERQKFILFTQDEKGKKAPAYAWKHPRVTHNRRTATHPEQFNVSVTTPQWHITLQECLDICQAMPNAVLWPTIVLGDIAEGQTAPRTIGEARKGDAPFLTQQGYFEFDCDLNEDDESQEWLDDKLWFDTQVKTLKTLFPISYRSVSGRGVHFPVRIPPDCEYFRTLNKITIEAPNKQAHIEVWTPVMKARAMIWGDAFNSPESREQVIPVITDEVMRKLKIFLPIEWDREAKAFDLPASLQWLPTADGALTRVMEANPDLFLDVRNPDGGSILSRYIQLEEGYLTPLFSLEGHNRLTALIKDADLATLNDLVNRGYPQKEVLNWRKASERNQGERAVWSLAKGINGSLEHFSRLHFEAKPTIAAIPRKVSLALNEVTWNKEEAYDPILKFEDGCFALATGQEVSKEEILHRSLTTDEAPVLYTYNKPVYSDSRFYKIGQEVWNAWAKANTPQALILLLTRRVRGMVFCVGETKRGKTTLAGILGNIGLGYTTPLGGVAEMLTKGVKGQADLFRKRDKALAYKRLIFADEFAPSFTREDFRLASTMPVRVDSQGFKDLTGRQTVEWRGLYKESVIAPIRATWIALCNEAPLISLNEEPVWGRVHGLYTPAENPILAGVHSEDYHHPAVGEGFLQAFLQDCRNIIPSWDTPPTFESLQVIQRATSEVHNWIGERNTLYQEYAQSKGKEPEYNEEVNNLVSTL